jgi:hypothetical protein
MKTQINTPEIALYAKRLASILCNQFYRQHSNIQGKQIVELSENKQINFFAVKTIFLKWQDEMANLKSPYFDYSNPEVNKTLTTLMNLLSQNISIARPTFEPVLQEAITDTILVYVSPKDFYAKFIASFSGTIHVANQVKPLAKYVKVNKSFFDRLLAYLEREANPTIGVARAEELLQVVANENLSKENVEELFVYLSKYVPVSVNNFLHIEDDPLHFDTATIIPKIESYVYTPEPTVIEEKQEKQISVETEISTSIYTKPASYEPVVAPKIEIVEAQKPETFTFNEQFAQQAVTQNSVQQHFSQEITKEVPVETKIVNELPTDNIDNSNGKILTLREFIPINKKFAFINGLFGGNSAEFEQAVDMIDQCNDYHKAIMLIKEKYFRRFAWDLEKDEVKEFYEMVSRKF